MLSGHQPWLVVGMERGNLEGRGGGDVLGSLSGESDQGG